MTLRARLFVVLGIVLAVLGIAGFAVVRTVNHSLRQQIDERLSGALPAAAGFALRNAFDQAVPPPRPDGPRPGVGSLSELAVAVLEPQAATAVPLVTPGLVDEARPAIDADLARRQATAQRQTAMPYTIESSGSGPRWRAAALRGSDGRVVVVAMSLEQTDAATRRVVVAGAIAGGTLLAVLLAASIWVVRLGLRPIREITDAADAISRGELSRRVDGSSSPRTESAHVARAFNVMLDERQASEDRLRRFVSDASHELRTPLASIRGFTDLYRRGGLPDDAAVADAMRRIGRESRRMGTLVDDLLLLARLDEGRPLERNAVDVSTLVRDVVFDASATHPGRPIHAEVADGLRVTGDEARLHQVVTNLVTNAFVHTPDATHVTVRAATGDGVVVIEVVDDGPGMDADSAAHAFDRFWRADDSRVRHTGGSGLGLSIVRSIVEAHGGRVALETAPGQGARFRVVLPA